jgi:hypothetical protein
LSLEIKFANRVDRDYAIETLERENQKLIRRGRFPLVVSDHTPELRITVANMAAPKPKPLPPLFPWFRKKPKHSADA